MAKKKEKEDEVEMPKKEFMKEHKRLIKVLKSPSRKDDAEEVRRQELEMQEYKRKRKD